MNEHWIILIDTKKDSGCYILVFKSANCRKWVVNTLFLPW